MDVLSGLLTVEFLGKAAWIWVAFLAIVAALLVFDLGVLNRDDHEIGVGESLRLSALYIVVAAVFGSWVWWYLGGTAGMLWFTGYLVEKSLSLDNVFVISLIFGVMGVPRAYQHRVLFWGILGVIGLRAMMIGVGAALVAQFAWVLFVFGAFLIITGAKMLFATEHAPDIAGHPVLRWLKRHLYVTDHLHGHAFFVRLPAAARQGRPVVHATPLFLTLVMVEVADLVFAVDSVPAILAITTDPYIVYTSNIFAILGLRALYFCLAAMIHRFSYLKYSLALVLIFIGGKIFYSHLGGKFPPELSLAVTIALLAGGVLISLARTRCRQSSEHQSSEHQPSDRADAAVAPAGEAADRGPR